MTDVATAPAQGPADPAERFLTRRTPAQRVHHVLHKYPALSPSLVLVTACIVFALLNHRFILPTNLSLIVQQVAVVGALAVGQTLVILTAGIDLSVGAIMVFSSMFMAKTAVDNGVPGWLAIIGGILVSTGAGFLNGLLVTRVKLPPFITTLGTLNIFTALTLLYSGSKSIQGSTMPGILTWTGTRFDVGPFRLSTGVLLLLLLYIGFWFALSQTSWGRHVYAVGDDAEAARLVGIQVNRVLLSVYTVAGFVFGITAWILIGRVSGASPNVASEANLESITAVVIGGTSLFGGRGVIYGSLLGAIIVGVFKNGLSLADVDPLYQTLAIGILVLVAVGVDQWIRRVKS